MTLIGCSGGSLGTGAHNLMSKDASEPSDTGRAVNPKDAGHDSATDADTAPDYSCDSGSGCGERMNNADPSCGDGEVTFGEICDDGGELGGCSDDCRTVEDGWTCPRPGEACTFGPRCGDGLVDVGEECDDSNEFAGDGCSERCLTEVGYHCPASGVPCVEQRCGADANCDGGADCSSCIDAGGCKAGPSGQCDSSLPCEPLTAAQACEGRCGIVSNGCSDEADDGVIDCSMYPEHACPEGTTCGGGGVANECGGAVTCEPLDPVVACGAVGCGEVSDGCSSSYVCGRCSAGSQCVAGQCKATCNALSQAEACQGKDCGIVTDGCGSEQANTFDCSTVPGGCTGGEYCGVNAPFECDAPAKEACTPASSCAELGWACGTAIDECGSLFDCASEGRACSPLETCIGGIDGPSQCLTTIGTGSGGACAVCDAVPRGCGRTPTRLTGRVVTPGRDDTNVGNQVGVPNAFVYILRANDETQLPPIEHGIPAGGTSCDRCADQELGPVLVGDTTDAKGEFSLQGNIPIGQEFVLVVKVGKFRRATKVTLPAEAACSETALPSALPENPTRLPRDMNDGLMVNLPRVAISTGELDAIECAFEKMGIAVSEFGNPGANGSGIGRIHLYRGGDPANPAGARIDDLTPLEDELYQDLARLLAYDGIVMNCEGPGWDGTFNQRDTYGANVREYVNRGGRVFASHLSFSWLSGNGTLAYAADTFFDTGLAAAASWVNNINPVNVGTGIVSLVGTRSQAAPRIQAFADWLVSEGITTAPNYQFTIHEPRSQAFALGASSEEFLYCEGGDCTGSNARPQQFSFNTPYGAPDEAVCGRVTYGGFHAVVGNNLASAVFPAHCSGDLTAQEKVLLYMLLDAGVCVGSAPKPPLCVPEVCSDHCGTIADGCGGVLDCPCATGTVCSLGVCSQPQCVPATCESQGAVCGLWSDGCGGVLDCGSCECQPATACPDQVNCGATSDGCSGSLDCGTCEAPQVCIAGQCAG